jgi:protein-tyrosine kinase
MGKISKALERSGLDTTVEDRVSPAVQHETIELPPQQEHVQRSSEGSRSKEARYRQTGSWDERLTLAMTGSTETAESFRVLRSRILYPDDDAKTYKTILVTSTAPKEGKSFVSANLGLALAQGVDQHSLLVDCDLRRPTLARLFGVSGDRGLADYLQSEIDLASLIQKTAVDKMSLLTGGKPPANPSELLGSVKMQDLVHELSRRYADRFIIFDSPPILAASEAIVLSQKVDGVVLVVRHGFSNRAQVKKIVEMVGRERIIGIVFNGYENSFLETKMFGQYQYYGSYDNAEGKSATT